MKEIEHTAKPIPVTEVDIRLYQVTLRVGHGDEGQAEAYDGFEGLHFGCRLRVKQRER